MNQKHERLISSVILVMTVSRELADMEEKYLHSKYKANHKKFILPTSKQG